MMIVYSRPNCLWCLKAKDLLRKHNQQFQEIMLIDDDLLKEFKIKYPQQKTVPFILNIDGSVVGSYDDLMKLYEQA